MSEEAMVEEEWWIIQWLGIRKVWVNKSTPTHAWVEGNRRKRIQMRDGGYGSVFPTEDEAKSFILDMWTRRYEVAQHKADYYKSELEATRANLSAS